MKNNSESLHEGDILRRYLKANYTINDIWQTLGYTSRQGLYFQLGKSQLSKDFIFLVEQKLKIDLSDILYPQKTESTPSLNPINIITGSGKKANRNQKQIYSPHLDNDNSLTLTLNPLREKRFKLLNDNYEINLDSFSATLPTRSDTNGWLPVIADVESLIDLQDALDKGDKRPNGWPMSAIEIVRDPNVKGQYRIQAPPYDNFYPLIRAGKWISVSKVDKYKYKTSVIYLVVFKDISCMLYYLAQGTTKDKVWLISENTKFGQREYDIEDIHSIYAVSPEI